MPYRSAASAIAVSAIISLSAPALAATAHNSQAGAFGPNTHQCAATPYFAAGGCAAETAIDGSTAQVLPRQAPKGFHNNPIYRTRPTLRGLDQ